jgi:hypothetical protein
MSQPLEDRLKALEARVKGMAKVQAKILTILGDTCTGGDDCASSYGHSWGCLTNDVERLKKELDELGLDYNDAE